MLETFAGELCGGSVTIHKSVKTGPATYIDGEGWSFSAPNATNTPQVTDNGGLANLEFDPDHLGAQTITESGTVGYSIESVVCTKEGNPVTVTGVTASSFGVTVDQLDIINCEVKNAPVGLGSISILKQTTSGVGGPFGFNVSGPNTDTDVSATTSQAVNPAAAAPVQNLYPGEYTVVESSLPMGSTLEDVDCGSAKTEPTANGVTISLGVDEDVTCTFTNDIPVDLSIVKTSSGDPVAGATQMTYTLAVTNNGPGENTDPIVVTDNLPVGLTYVSASGPGWVCNNAGQAVTCTHDDQLAVGSTSNITVVTNINQGTILASTTNCATVIDLIVTDSNDTSCVTNNTSAVLVASGGAGNVAAAGGLPVTGSNPVNMIRLALALLLAGLALVGITWFRRRESEITEQ